MQLDCIIPPSMHLEAIILHSMLLLETIKPSKQLEGLTLHSMQLQAITLPSTRLPGRAGTVT